jgi:glucose uptake protein
LYALITVLAWGSWLAPSQNVRFRNQQIKTFYVAAANLLLATIVFSLQGSRGLSGPIFWLPFAGGLIWALSGYLAFTATERLGMARAFGIWSPINSGVSLLWGGLLFGEFAGLGGPALARLAGSLILILAGVLLIIFAKGAGRQSQAAGAAWVGLLGALGAGVLWGSYYIPVQLSAASLWVAAFPLAVGIFTGSAILAAVAGQPLRLERASDFARVSATGLLWGIGNYAMLLLVEQIGAGRGYTISQLGIVVNGLLGIFLLKDPQPGTRAGWLTLAGCLLAMVGAILLGNLN